MKRTVLDDILDFADHKNEFNDEEQDRILESFRKDIRKRLSKLNSTIMKSIEDVNRL